MAYTDETRVGLPDAVTSEMRRIRALFVSSPHDKEDLATYAKEIIRLRARPTDPGEDKVEAVVKGLDELAAWLEKSGGAASWLRAVRQARAAIAAMGGEI